MCVQPWNQLFLIFACVGATPDLSEETKPTTFDRRAAVKQGNSGTNLCLWVGKPDTLTDTIGETEDTDL